MTRTSNRLGKPVALRRPDKVEGFEEFFRRFQQPLFKFFRARGFAEAEVSDLVQDTFLRVFKDIDRLSKPETLDSWLFAVARNVAGAHLRSNRALRSSAGAPVDSDGKVASTTKDLDEERSIPHALMASIERLPNQMRDIARLRIQNGLSYSEIADFFGISVQTVKAHLFQARRRLQEMTSEFSRTDTLSFSEVVEQARGLEADIDSAYDAISDLSRVPATPERDAQVEQTFARLRELQHREAEQFRQQFEENLLMPLDAGAGILGRSRNLRKQFEDLAATNSSKEPASASTPTSDSDSLDPVPKLPPLGLRVHMSLLSLARSRPFRWSTWRRLWRNDRRAQDR